MILEIANIKFFFSNQQSILESIINSPNPHNLQKNSETKPHPNHPNWFCLVTWKQKIESNPKQENGVIKIDNFGKRIDKSEIANSKQKKYKSQLLNQILESRIFQKNNPKNISLERPDIITDDMNFFEKIRHSRRMARSGILIEKKLVALLYQNLLSYVMTKSAVEVSIRANFAFQKGVLEPFTVNIKKEANLMKGEEIDYNKFSKTTETAVKGFSLVQNVKISPGCWGKFEITKKITNDDCDFSQIETELSLELDSRMKKLYFYEVTGGCLVADLWNILEGCGSNNKQILVNME